MQISGLGYPEPPTSQVFLLDIQVFILFVEELCIANMKHLCSPLYEVSGKGCLTLLGLIKGGLMVAANVRVDIV